MQRCTNKMTKESGMLTFLYIELFRSEMIEIKINLSIQNNTWSLFGVGRCVFNTCVRVREYGFCHSFGCDMTTLRLCNDNKNSAS